MSGARPSLAGRGNGVGPSEREMGSGQGKSTPDSAVVEVEELGCGTQYTLKREGDGWVVVSERMTWMA